MSSSKISRRRLLQASAGLAALLSPIFRKTDARADVVAPRRIILVFSPNGPMTATGPASGTETAFTLHDWWKPLERHRGQSIFLSNLSSTGAGVVPGDGHGLGGQCFAGFGAGADGYNSRGETIDQTIAKALEAQNRAGLVRSVVWGLQGGNAFWAAADRSIAAETDPSKAWASLFGNFTPPSADPARVAAEIARQRSVLDFLKQDCDTLKSALGSEGMRSLDEHCTALRERERLIGATLSCTKPADPGASDWTNPDRVDAQMAAFTDLIAMSLACELTNVVAFQFGGQAARNRIASSYGVPSSPTADSGDSGPAHHPWTHQDKTLSTTTDAMRIFTTFYSNQIALLVDKLKTTPDASGKPLLDSTVVVWLSELGGKPGNGDAHITGCVPGVLIGNGQGTFNTGRYIQGSSTGGNPGTVEGGREMARLLVSVMRYMGLDVNTVGTTGVSGPFAALQV